MILVSLDYLLFYFHKNSQNPFQFYPILDLSKRTPYPIDLFQIHERPREFLDFIV